MDDSLCKRKRTELVIVSRDSDYGIVYGEKNYVNDDLRQEFSERVSQKRKLLLYQKLSDAFETLLSCPRPNRNGRPRLEIVTAASEQQAATVEAKRLTWNELMTSKDVDSSLYRIKELLREATKNMETIKPSDK